VMPVVRRLLVEDAEADRMIVAVTDAAGRMLWVEGDAALRSQAAGMNFVEGSRWAEDVAGTNAPGTALALDHPVQIYGSEHFRRPVQPWSCSAAPVHDPVSGALLGAIDVTGGDHVASPHVLTLVRATVAAVEAELRWLHREQAARGGARGDAPPAPRPVPRLDVLGRDRARLVGPAGRTEFSLRHSELLLLLAEAAVTGTGRTAEELAAECHVGGSVPVTVRAELSRLRRTLGPELLDSRPYRLRVELDADFAAVTRLLEHGRVAEALDAYAGPLLPSSDAPGVIRLRRLVEGQLRAAVLASGDRVLMRTWLHAPHGADDLQMWESYAALLPPGSPIRPLAEARVRQLAIEFGVATSLQRR
jgi:hypothetical protein